MNPFNILTFPCKPDAARGWHDRVVQHNLGRGFTVCAIVWTTNMRDRLSALASAGSSSYTGAAGGLGLEAVAVVGGWPCLKRLLDSLQNDEVILMPDNPALAQSLARAGKCPSCVVEPLKAPKKPAPTLTYDEPEPSKADWQVAQDHMAEFRVIAPAPDPLPATELAPRQRYARLAGPLKSRDKAMELLRKAGWKITDGPVGEADIAVVPSLSSKANEVLKAKKLGIELVPESKLDEYLKSKTDTP